MHPEHPELRHAPQTQGVSIANYMLQVPDTGLAWDWGEAFSSHAPPKGGETEVVWRGYEVDRH